MSCTWSHGIWSHGHIYKILAFGNQPALKTDHRNAAASFSSLSSQTSHPFGYLGPTLSPSWVPAGLGPASHPTGSHTSSMPPPSHLASLRLWEGEDADLPSSLPIQRLHAAILEVGATLKSSFDFHNLRIVAAPKNDVCFQDGTTWPLYRKSAWWLGKWIKGGELGLQEPSHVGDSPKSVGLSGTGNGAQGASRGGGGPGLAHLWVWELLQCCRYAPRVYPIFWGPPHSV